MCHRNIIYPCMHQFVLIMCKNFLLLARVMFNVITLNLCSLNHFIDYKFKS